MNFGEPSAVTTDSRRHVFVLDRGGISGPAYGAASGRVLKFDTDGKFVREFAKDLCSTSYGHGIRADRQDNIWIADKGSGTIVKIKPDGHVDMVFGRRAEASESEGQGPPAISRAAANEAAACASARTIPPADRYGLGLRGQLVHH
jgi:streptogramin lyase